MIDGTKLLLFLSAAVVLAVMPGPGILYVLGRTLNGGRREGVHSALGTFLGGFAIAAAIGLSGRYNQTCLTITREQMRWPAWSLLKRTGLFFISSAP
jgi:threonine/homoserine/homoserine lactone efflux protein